jgi:hypothetical protein
MSPSLEEPLDSPSALEFPSTSEFPLASFYNKDILVQQQDIFQKLSKQQIKIYSQPRRQIKFTAI